jgi:hypothetical protein
MIEFEAAVLKNRKTLINGQSISTSRRRWRHPTTTKVENREQKTLRPEKLYNKLKPQGQNEYLQRMDSQKILP